MKGFCLLSATELTPEGLALLPVVASALFGINFRAKIKIRKIRGTARSVAIRERFFFSI